MLEERSSGDLINKSQLLKKKIKKKCERDYLQQKPCSENVVLALLQSIPNGGIDVPFVVKMGLQVSF